MGSGVFSPPVSISPSGTPLGEPARRESNVTTFVERRRKVPAGQDRPAGPRASVDRAGPALDRFGSPPVPRHRDSGDRDGHEGLGAIGGPGDRHLGPAAARLLEVVTGWPTSSHSIPHRARLFPGADACDPACRAQPISSNIEFTTRHAGLESSNRLRHSRLLGG